MADSIQIKYNDEDGKERYIFVKKPSHSQLSEANMHSAAIFNKARKAGAVLRNELDDWLEKEGIWDTDHIKKIKELDESLNKKLQILLTGKKEDNSKLKLSEARKLTAEISFERWKRNILLIDKRKYDEYTVEGQAENGRFDSLASLCLLDEEGNRLFNNIDEYFENSEKSHIIEAASKLANLIFGTDDWEKNLPETKFLLDHKMVDEQGRYINKNGQFIDIDGNIVEEKEEKEIEKQVELPDYEDDL